MNKWRRTGMLYFFVGLLVACTAPSSPPSPPTLVTESATSTATNPPTAVSANPTATLEPSPTTAEATATAAPTTSAENERATPTIATLQTDDLTVAWEGNVTLRDYTVINFPQAGSVSITLTPDGTLYAALGIDDYLYVARSTDHGRTFNEPVQVSTEQLFVLPVERPAIVATADGRVSVAWTSPELNGRIWYTFSKDGGQTFGPAQTISGAPARETILPRLVLDNDSNPVASWLANSTLRYARSADGGESFAEPHVLDDQTCECCHPQPLVEGDQLFIAYRNLEIEEATGINIRDIFLLHSTDGGQTFEPEIRVSDGSWKINACPISGPAMVKDGDTIYVSWMDGRNDTQGNFQHTDIWLAASTDGGQTFSPNYRLNFNAGLYHNLPSLAVDANGTLHAVWEALEPQRDVIYYAQSADQGLTFTTPIVVVDSANGNGRRPGNTSLVVDEAGLLYMSWVDSEGVHIASWSASPADS